MVNVLTEKNVLLVGDAILDVYIHAESVGEALYAPVPEVEERRVELSWGGNGLVAAHMLELGGHVRFVTVVGADRDAELYEDFTHPNLQKVCITDESRRTTVKRRWYVGTKALLQANQVCNHDVPQPVEDEVVCAIHAGMQEADIIVAMDPQHGVLTHRVIQTLIDESKKWGVPLCVNAQISHQPSNHHLYKGAYAMLLNQREAKAVYPAFTLRALKTALQAIGEKLALTNVVVTLGARGSAALWGGEYIRVPAEQVHAIDPCGAGDAYLAALALCDLSRPKEALTLANRWAALSTTIHGTVPPKRNALL